MREPTLDGVPFTRCTTDALEGFLRDDYEPLPGSTGDVGFDRRLAFRLLMEKLGVAI